MSEGTRSSEGSIGESARWIALGTAWKPGWGGEGQIGGGGGGGLSGIERTLNRRQFYMYRYIPCACMQCICITRLGGWVGGMGRGGGGGGCRRPVSERVPLIETSTLKLSTAAGRHQLTLAQKRYLISPPTRPISPICRAPHFSHISTVILVFTLAQFQRSDPVAVSTACPKWRNIYMEKY